MSIKLEVNPTYIDPQLKIAHHQDLIENVVDRTPMVPRHFEVDLTRRCNLACRGCHFAYTHTPITDRSKDMPPQLWERIISDMKDNGVKAVTFTGGGEPLLHPKKLQIFEATKAAGIQIGLYTNGVLLEGEIADFMAEYGDWCYVSLDATDADEYESYKQRGAKIFRKNIDNVARFAARQDRKAQIGVGYLVGPHNIDGLEHARDKLLALGTDYVQLRPIIDTGDYDEQFENHEMSVIVMLHNDQEGWQRHYSWIPQALERLGSFEEEARVYPSLKKFSDLYRGQRDYDECLSTSVTGCIGSLGEVWRCVNLREMDQLGDLNLQTLQEIFLAKPVGFRDLTRCRVMCRNDQLNQALDRIVSTGQIPDPNSSLQHINFI